MTYNKVDLASKISNLAGKMNDRFMNLSRRILFSDAPLNTVDTFIGTFKEEEFTSYNIVTSDPELKKRIRQMMEDLSIEFGLKKISGQDYGQGNLN